MDIKMASRKSERGQALVEMMLGLITLPAIIIMMAFFFNVYITQIQLFNGAYLGTSLVVHDNILAEPGESTTPPGYLGEGGRRVWQSVRDYLCATGKGTGGTGDATVIGRKLEFGTTALPVRNDENHNVNVWCESQKWGASIPGNAANFIPGPPGPGFSKSNVTFYEPTEPYLTGDQVAFDVVVRYRIPVYGLMATIIGESYLVVSGRSRTANDTGMENRKNFSKS